mgnify:CR=1 FL=1
MDNNPNPQDTHKTVEEIFELPASEINGWRDYFNIYPFTQDREDFRMARICEMLNLATQHLGYKDKNFTFFMPEYLDYTPTPKRTEEEKLADERAYVQILIASGLAVMEIKQ